MSVVDADQVPFAFVFSHHLRCPLNGPCPKTLSVSHNGHPFDAVIAGNRRIASEVIYHVPSIVSVYVDVPLINVKSRNRDKTAIKIFNTIVTAIGPLSPFLSARGHRKSDQENEHGYYRDLLFHRSSPRPSSSRTPSSWRSARGLSSPNSGPP